MGDWFNVAQQQYDHAVPSYLEDEPDEDEFDEQDNDDEENGD